MMGKIIRFARDGCFRYLLIEIIIYLANHDKFDDNDNGDPLHKIDI